MIPSILARYMFRDLARHKALHAIAFLGIMIGVAVSAAMDLAISASNQSFQDSADASAGKTTHHYTPGDSGVPAADFFLLKQSGLFTMAPLLEIRIEFQNSPYTLLGVDPFSEAEFRPPSASISANSYILAPDTVLLPNEERFATVKPGDSLEFNIYGNLRKLKSGGTLPVQTGSLLFADIALVEQYNPNPGRITRIDFIIPEDKEQQTQEAMERILAKKVQLLPAAKRKRNLVNLTSAFRTNLTALSLMAMLTGAFLIYNSINFSVVRRRETISILRALGTTSGEVFRMILLEAVTLGLLGSVAGLVAGTALAVFLLDLVSVTVNQLYYQGHSASTFSISATALAKALALGTASSIVSAWFPAREAAGLSPAISRSRSTYESIFRKLAVRGIIFSPILLVVSVFLIAFYSDSLFVSFLAVFVFIVSYILTVPGLTWFTLSGILRLPLPPKQRFLISSAGSSLSRSAPAIAALVLAVALTISISTMIQSFRQAIEEWLAQTLQADVYTGVMNPGLTLSPLPLDFVERAKKLPQTRDYTTFHATQIETPKGRLRLISGQIAIDARKGFQLIDALESPWDKFVSGNIFVSEPLARRQSLKPGNSLTFLTDKGPVPFSIAGIFRDYSSENGVVMMDQAIYRNNWNDKSISSISIFAKDNPAELAKQLEEIRTPGSFIVVRELSDIRTMTMEIFDRTFSVTSALRLLAMIVAFLGFLGALSSLEIEKRREHAVLRALGFTQANLTALIFSQSGIFAAFAALLALPLGFSMAWLLIYVINVRSFGWSMPMATDPSFAIAAFLLAIIPALLSSALITWKMRSMNISAAIKEE